MSEPGRVDFYILTEADDAARLRFACRLTEKAWQLQHRVHLHTASAADSARLDDLLWSFRQGSFLPHEIAREGELARAPITVGHAGNAPPADLLINLAGQVPPFTGRFERVAEIVDASEAGRAQGRERYRHYQQAGCQPVTHNIGTSQ